MCIITSPSLDDDVFTERLNDEEIQYGNNTECLFGISGSEMSEDSREWKMASAELPSGIHQRVIFIADRLSANYMIGLDNIRVRNKDSENGSNCSTNYAPPTMSTITKSLDDYFH